jgi:beta-galactosidase
LGGEVAQFYALTDPVPVRGTWGSGESHLWAEQLKVEGRDTEVLLRYGKSNGWLDDQPAALTRVVGKGRITYIGAWLDNISMSNAISWMLKDSGVSKFEIELPEEVEGSVLSGAGKKIWILVNVGDSERSIVLPRQMSNVLSGERENVIKLGRLDVAVLKG